MNDDWADLLCDVGRDIARLAVAAAVGLFLLGMIAGAALWAFM